MLNVAVEDLGHLVILHCRGRIVAGEETSILCAAVSRHGRAIAIDLSSVTAIDAAGIGALVALQAAGVYLHLVNPTEPVRRVLDVTGMNSVFEITSAEAALTTSAA
jgi:anti-anti-sigma factor